MMLKVTMFVVYLCLTTVTSKSGSYNDTPGGCSKFTSLVKYQKPQKYQVKTYHGGMSDFNANLWSFDCSMANGPNSWGDLYPTCVGIHQSPIHIKTKDVKCDNRLTDFHYRGYDTIPAKPFSVYKLTPWQAVSFEADEVDISIRGDWLDTVYTLYYMYLAAGCVHQIDDNIAPLQIGFVHWNSKKYSTHLEAENSGGDGVIVLNVLVEVTNDQTKLDNQVAEAIDNIIAGAGNETYIPNFPLSRLLPSCRMYYKYQGGYPVPNCVEYGYWTIFEQPIYISKKQYASLNKVMSGSTKRLENIDRPMQPLNGRVVTTIC